jgi:hypothetical protein
VPSQLTIVTWPDAENSKGVFLSTLPKNPTMATKGTKNMNNRKSLNFKISP